MGAMLLHESASAIFLCEAPPPEPDPLVKTVGATPTAAAEPTLQQRLHLPSLSKYLPQVHSRSPSPEPALSPIHVPPRPRRLVVLVVALAPHRAGMWSTSARPGESALRYTLLNGCPALVLPARAGAPLVSWDTLTLAELHGLSDELPPPELEGGSSTAASKGEDNKGGPRFRGALEVLNEYMSLCVEWDRVRLEHGKDVEGEEAGGSPGDSVLASELERKDAVRDALAILLIAAICSKDSKQVKKEVDADRAGIVIFRIP